MSEWVTLNAGSNELAESLLRGLAERYSPSTHEELAVSYLVGRMRDLGARAWIDEAGNAVGEWGAGDRQILLLGHIDTVPGEIPVRRKGRRLYGRGTVDAKGPLAAFVMAAARSAVGADKRVTVVGAVEEEAATSKGARFVLSWARPEAVVIGEPSGWDRVVVGYKGRLLVDYTLEQPVGHTAGPDASACERAVQFWIAACKHAARHNQGRSRLFEQLTPSLRAIISGGNGFSEWVEMTVGYRLPPETDVDALEEWLTTCAGDATLRFRGREVAYRAPRSSPLARAFTRAIAGAGGRTVFALKTGTSDMNVVGPIWSCPIVAYGPGDSRLDHTPEEHIDLDEYHRAIRVLEHVIRRL